MMSKVTSSSIMWWFWFILLLQSHCLCSGFEGLSSVRPYFSKKKGIVITAFRFRSSHPNSTKSSLKPPLWVTNFLNMSTTHRSEGFQLNCFVEMIGFMRYPRNSVVGNINGSAQLMHSDLGPEGVKCRYRNTFPHVALDGKCIPLVYYCEVDGVDICRRIGTVSGDISSSKHNGTSAGYKLFKVKTYRNESIIRTSVTAMVQRGHVVPESVSMFDRDSSTTNMVIKRAGAIPSITVNSTRSPSQRVKLSIFEKIRRKWSHRRLSFETLNDTTAAAALNTLASISAKSEAIADVAVCVVLPYNTHDLIMKSILMENIRWYRDVLGFRVMIYDSNGAHRKFLQHNGMFDNSTQLLSDYHDYTVFDIIGHGVRRLKAILDTDFDKILTLTHCRMEVRALYDIESVLVVDSDEFLYCPSSSDIINRSATITASRSIQESARALRNYQRDTVHNLLRVERAKGFVDQIAFTRFSPMFAGAKGSSPYIRNQCMANTLLGGKASLFSCFASIRQRRGNYLSKSLSLNYACPHTSNHYSCPIDSHAMPDMCECFHEDIGVSKCFIIHVRVLALNPKLEMAKAGNADMKRGDRLELDAIMTMLPRPRAPESKFNRTLHEANIRAMIAANNKKPNKSSIPPVKPMKKRLKRGNLQEKGVT